MSNTLYLVTYDGYYAGYGTEIYCGGIFDTKEKAEDYIRNDANLPKCRALISELKLNEGLTTTNDDIFATIRTDVHLGGYLE